MQVEADPNSFLAAGSRVHSVCNMSATHLSDNLPTLLAKFPTMLGHTVSAAKLASRGYSCDYRLDKACDKVTDDDFKNNPMESPLVREYMLGRNSDPRGTLGYICANPFHQGWTNLKGSGQMTGPEKSEYLRARHATPAQLPPMPASLAAVLRKSKYVPKFNHNAGSARVLARDLLPKAAAAALTAAQVALRDAHFCGVKDIGIAIVMTQKDSGTHPGVLQSYITPSMEKALTDQLAAAGRPWLGILDEGFETAVETDVNKFIKLCVEAGFTHIWLIGALFRNFSVVADMMYGDCVINSLVCAPKQGVMLNELEQLLDRMAGVGVADRRERRFGDRLGTVLIKKADHDQLECAKNIVAKLFEVLSPSEPMDTAEVKRILLEDTMYSERFKVLQGAKARSCGRAGELVNALNISTADAARACGSPYVDFTPKRIEKLCRKGQPLDLDGELPPETSAAARARAGAFTCVALSLHYTDARSL